MNQDGPLSNEMEAETVLPKGFATDELNWSRRRVTKNLLCVSISDFLLYTGYEGVTTIQSMTSSQAGVGLASQIVINAFFCLSTMFLPKLIIRKIGCKKTIVLSLFAYCPYIASNFYPNWSTLIPTAAILGLSAGLFWASSSTYLNRLAVLSTGNESDESIRALFFGISITFFKLSNLSGNLISFFVLQEESGQAFKVSQNQCGIVFVEDSVSDSNRTNSRAPEADIRNILIGTFLSLGTAAVLLVYLFVDPLPAHQNDAIESSFSSSLTATFCVMKRQKQLCLMPFAIYIGMVEGFYLGNITKDYIACAWGIYHVGLVVACMGLVSALCSSLSGRLRNYTGRIPMYATAAVANIFVFTQLLLWRPDADKAYLFFLNAAVWGIFNGIYLVQLRAFYGLLFWDEEESAFANFFLWNAVGSVMSIAYIEYLSISTKLYLLIAVFCLSQVGYIAVEYDLRVVHGKNTKKLSTSDNQHFSSQKTLEMGSLGGSVIEKS